MNKFSLPDENELNRLFVHYKKFYLSFAIVLICFGLVIWFILPEIQQYSDQRAQLQDVLAKVDTLKRNIAIASAINDQQQTEDLQTVLTALPQDKDYAGILYSVKSASAKANVSIGDFSFQVGELSSKAVITRSMPYLSLQVNLTGSPLEVSSFISEISKTLPLSNVTEVALNNTYSSIKVDFYYKPIPQLRVNYIDPLASLSSSDQTLLTELKTWQKEETVFDIAAPDIPASSSASPFEQ